MPEHVTPTPQEQPSASPWPITPTMWELARQRMQEIANNPRAKPRDRKAARRLLRKLEELEANRRLLQQLRTSQARQQQ